jgi:hypothetical protein
MAWQRCKDIARAAEEKGLDRFLTLTLNPHVIPDGYNPYRYIWDVWGKFRVYLGRRYDEAISYICVLELHESGLPHLHALVDQFIPQRWISEAWEAVGGGRIVFIERTKEIRDIGRYLAKYLTKRNGASSLHRLRRISTSRDIKLRQFDPGEFKWHVSPIGMDAIEKIAGERIDQKLYDRNGFIREMTAAYAVEEPSGVETVEGNVVIAGGSKGNDDGGGDGQGSLIRAGIEQGTIRERILNTCPKEIAERLRREAEAIGRKRIRGSRKR